MSKEGSRRLHVLVRGTRRQRVLTVRTVVNLESPNQDDWIILLIFLYPRRYLTSVRRFNSIQYFKVRRNHFRICYTDIRIHT